MVVALANFVPRTGQEVDCITELGTHCLAWTDDSSSEEEGKQMQEEDDMHEQTQEEDDMHEQMQEEDEHPLWEDNKHGEVEGWGEPNPKALPGNQMCCQGEVEPGMELWRQSWEWASIMDEEQPLTFKDLRLDSDHSTLCSTPLEPGLPEDVMEVHTPDLELQALWTGGVGGAILLYVNLLAFSAVL